MEYSDFKNLLSTAIQEIKKEVTFNCNLVTLSENDEKYKTSLDIGCVLKNDEVTGSLFFFSKLSNYVLRLAIERDFSKDDQINTILMLNNFHNVNNMDNGYLYFYWNKNIASDSPDVNQELPVKETMLFENNVSVDQSVTYGSSGDHSLIISFPKQEDMTYLMSIDFYKGIFLSRAKYLLFQLKQRKGNYTLLSNIIKELKNIPLTKESNELILSLKGLTDKQIELPDVLVENISDKIKIGNLSSNSNCIYTLLG